MFLCPAHIVYGAARGPRGRLPLRASPRYGEVAASRAGRSALRRIRPRPASWGEQAPQGGPLRASPRLGALSGGAV